MPDTALRNRPRLRSRAGRLTLTIAAAGLLLAAAGPRKAGLKNVEVRYDHSVDFSPFRSFQCRREARGPEWMALAPRTRHLAAVEAAIVRQLEENGLEHLDDGADLVVSFSLTMPSTGNRGPALRRRRVSHLKPPDQLDVKVFRREDERLHIWQGTRKKLFGKKLDQAEARIAEAVEQLLAEFPPE